MCVCVGGGQSRRRFFHSGQYVIGRKSSFWSNPFFCPSLSVWWNLAAVMCDGFSQTQWHWFYFSYISGLKNLLSVTDFPYNKSASLPGYGHNGIYKVKSASQTLLLLCEVTYPASTSVSPHVCALCGTAVVTSPFASEMMTLVWFIAHMDGSRVAVTQLDWGWNSSMLHPLERTQRIRLRSQ